MLLRAGANAKATNRYGLQPITLAAINGNAEIDRGLLKAGADPNTTDAEGEPVLMTAARTGRVDAVEGVDRAWRRRQRAREVVRRDGA